MNIEIKGKPIDQETRCEHYHNENDIVAIKFCCCNSYFPCYKCHEESTDHKVELWPQEKFGELAVLCGKCNTELSIHHYLTSGSTCLSCGAAFNDKCSLHYHLYFQL
ncbi:CHY zinc finger protein [Alkalihalobacillus sp. R86527]|uniref:CHY zinc finger protein n=1 Tax=Alkalihalobacillus sp. R86527 TaxID=3093863 RepID=UPI00366E704D